MDPNNQWHYAIAQVVHAPVAALYLAGYAACHILINILDVAWLKCRFRVFFISSLKIRKSQPNLEENSTPRRVWQDDS